MWWTHLCQHQATQVVQPCLSEHLNEAHSNHEPISSPSSQYISVDSRLGVTALLSTYFNHQSPAACFHFIGNGTGDDDMTRSEQIYLQLLALFEIDTVTIQVYQTGLVVFVDQGEKEI